MRSIGGVAVVKRRRSGQMLRGLCVLGLSLGLGCGASTPASVEAEPLRIAAASDLRLVLPEILDRFRAGGDAVDVTYGASGQLAEQLREGAPFDVLLSADMSFVEALASEGVVASESVKPYARGALVIAVHEAAEGAVNTIADLAKPEVRKIAIANPRFAPYGRAAGQALERASLAEAVGPRLVLAESVRQAFLYAEQGDADAALVSRSLTGDGGALKVIEVDSGLYDPLVQGLGIVARSDKLDRARRFAAFLVGDAGQAILGAHGFKAPAESAEHPSADEGFSHGG